MRIPLGVLSSCGVLAYVFLHKTFFSKPVSVKKEEACPTCSVLAGWKEEDGRSGCYTYINTECEGTRLCAIMTPLYPITTMNAVFTNMDKIHPCKEIVYLICKLVAAEFPVPSEVPREVMNLCCSVMGQPEARELFLSEVMLLLPFVANRVSRRVTAMASMRTTAPIKYEDANLVSSVYEIAGRFFTDPNPTGKGVILNLINNLDESFSTLRVVAKDPITGLSGVVTMRTSVRHPEDPVAITRIGGTYITSRAIIELVDPENHLIQIATELYFYR